MSSQSCQLCLSNSALLKNSLGYVKSDNFSSAPGHVLVVPFRHVADFFSLTAEEKQAILMLLDGAKDLIDSKFSPHGYNIGVNVGKVAGQTRMHTHVHLIPRFQGDSDDPHGGVRCVLAKAKRLAR
jgi:diadenosine tetraphosphate (Ap4A) HIT family hydrolase